MDDKLEPYHSKWNVHIRYRTYKLFNSAMPTELNYDTMRAIRIVIALIYDFIPLISNTVCLGSGYLTLQPARVKFALPKIFKLL